MFRASRRVRLSIGRAFTLVELLVVVSIIALLVSILLPSLSRAKGLAKMVKCMTNMHAIGRAAHMYATDNDDYVPRGAAGGNNIPGFANHGWYLFAVKFSPYVGGPEIPFEYDDDWIAQYDFFKEIPAYKCPGFQDPEYVLTYVTNARNFARSYGSVGSEKLSELPRAPAEIGYICGLNPANASLGPIGCFGAYDFWANYSGGWYGPQLTFADNGDPNPNPRILRYDDMRHVGKATIVFFEGHVESRNLVPEEMTSELFFPEPD